MIVLTALGDQIWVSRCLCWVLHAFPRVQVRKVRGYHLCLSWHD